MPIGSTVTKLTVQFTCEVISDVVIFKYRSILSYMTPNVLTETRCHQTQLVWRPCHKTTITSTWYHICLYFRSDLAYFDGLSETVVAAALVKPRPGIFQPHIMGLLCLATPVDIVLLGVSFSKPYRTGKDGENWMKVVYGYRMYKLPVLIRLRLFATQFHMDYFKLIRLHALFSLL